MAKRDVNYATYLEIEQLLSLQRPLSEPEEHDELLFIIIHQTYELWFKQLLHELDRVNELLSAGELFPATAVFRRVRMILKTLVGQLDILETMTPVSFAAFRDRLDTASGFQSTQYREVEFVLGRKREKVLEWLDPGWPGTQRALRRYAEPTVVDAFYRFLVRQGVEVPEHILERDLTETSGPCPEIQPGILELYRARPEMALLFELMTDCDEGLQEWRYRHVKIAERTIGNKTGTGGSPGVEYLKQALFQPVFHDLWAIRHEM